MAFAFLPVTRISRAHLFPAIVQHVNPVEDGLDAREPGPAERLCLLID